MKYVIPNKHFIKYRINLSFLRIRLLNILCWDDLFFIWQQTFHLTILKLSVFCGKTQIFLSDFAIILICDFLLIYAKVSDFVFIQCPISMKVLNTNMLTTRRM